MTTNVNSTEGDPEPDCNLPGRADAEQYRQRSGPLRPLNLLALLGASLIVTGCVTPKPVASDVSSLTVKQAQSSLSVESSAPGERVRWGGTIASVTNKADGSTVLEVVSRPLRGSGRPQRNDRTDGRFLASVNEFLDPEIVKAGRDVTVTGEVSTLEQGKVGESAYTFPVVRVEQYRYWKPQQNYPPPHFPHPNLYPYYADPFWYDDWPFRPHRYRRGSGVSGRIIFP